MATRLQTPERGTDLYERDYYAWTQAQAVALRRLRQQEAETALDLAHLAEEVGHLGRSERDAVRTQVRRIIEHLLKLEYAQARDGCKDTAADARAVLDDKLSASLRRDLEAVWPRLYAQVRPKVGRALRRFDEPDAAAALPADCPYDLDDIGRPEWYPANRRGIANGATP
jgi:hypothetical protein